MSNREEAIDILTRMSTNHFYGHREQEAFKLGAEALKQRWIPVTEMLPEEERKHYWICTDTGYQCECRWTNNQFGLGESDKWGWSIFDVPQYSHVVAWMPLPKPYKEGEEE